MKQTKKLTNKTNYLFRQISSKGWAGSGGSGSFGAGTLFKTDAHSYCTNTISVYIFLPIKYTQPTNTAKRPMDNSIKQENTQHMSNIPTVLDQSDIILWWKLEWGPASSSLLAIKQSAHEVYVYHMT